MFFCLKCLISLSLTFLGLFSYGIRLACSSEASRRESFHTRSRWLQALWLSLALWVHLPNPLSSWGLLPMSSHHLSVPRLNLIICNNPNSKSAHIPRYQELGRQHTCFGEGAQQFKASPYLYIFFEIFLQLCACFSILFSLIFIM